MSEFDLIASYFTWSAWDEHNSDQSERANKSTQYSSQVIQSIGDDAAVLSLPLNKQLVTSIDTLVSGVHFPIGTAAYDIGYKALAVNLSDLAAMGSKPEWFTLALTLPEVDHAWLSEFSRGLKTLAKEFGIALVGGDTTSGPLAISIQVMGSVDNGNAIYRSGANLGDNIYVTGTLGDGAAGLASLKEKLGLTTAHAEYCQQRLNRPTPRLCESDLIKSFASSCIDVSDGLLQDLSHILQQSTLRLNQNIKTNVREIDEFIDNFGAKLDLSKIPFSQALKSIDQQQAMEFALSGGDDYEILFTIAESLESQFLEASNNSGYQFTRIGTITSDNGIVDANNTSLMATGYNHFHE